MILRSSVTRWEIFKFVLRNVPMVLWAGVKVRALGHNRCVTYMHRNWRNRNPYNGTYFAALLTGAEMASGLMVFDELRTAKRLTGLDLAARIVNVNASFKRQATRYAEFICEDGYAIEKKVIDGSIYKSRKGETVQTHVRVINESGKLAAEITITWVVGML